MSSGAFTLLSLLLLVQRSRCGGLVNNGSFVHHSGLEEEDSAHRALRQRHRNTRELDKTDMLTYLEVGQGTTATRALYKILCKNRVPSCHFWVCCNFRNKRARAVEYQKFSDLYNLIGVCLENDEEALHRDCGVASDFQSFDGEPPPYNVTRERYPGDVWGATECEPGPGCCKGHVPTDTRLRQVGCSASKLLVTAEEVIRDQFGPGTDVRALADVPMVNFLGSFVELFPRTSYRIIMTRRDPKIWAPKRITEHPEVQPMMCGHDNGARLGDFGGCIRSALERHQGDRPLLISDVFVHINDNLTAAEEALAQYQDQFIPKLARISSERAGESVGSIHGRYFMEFDLFEETVNRVEVGSNTDADDASLTDEERREERETFLPVVREAVENWIRSKA